MYFAARLLQGYIVQPELLFRKKYCATTQYFQRSPYRRTTTGRVVRIHTQATIIAITATRAAVSGISPITTRYQSVLRKRHYNLNAEHGKYRITAKYLITFSGSAHDHGPRGPQPQSSDQYCNYDNAGRSKRHESNYHPLAKRKERRKSGLEHREPLSTPFAR